MMFIPMRYGYMMSSMVSVMGNWGRVWVIWGGVMGNWGWVWVIWGGLMGYWGRMWVIWGGVMGYWGRMWVNWCWMMMGNGSWVIWGGVVGFMMYGFRMDISFMGWGCVGCCMD